MYSKKMTLWIALLVGFIDFVGVGLIYPLFSPLLFNDASPLLPPGTSHEMRGFWLGLLLALAPLVQFFSSPVWGALSDQRGRKKMLQASLTVALCGYIAAALALLWSSLTLLLLSRVIIGFSAGNISIVQATVADLSSEEEKAKNFGLYSMALGAGFTLGPFFGGVLSSWSPSLPFLFALLITALNLAFTLLFFQETHFQKSSCKLNWKVGIEHLKKAIWLKNIRLLLVAYFLHCFGWDFFFEFASVYLIDHFHFSAEKVGFFYALSGACYALSTGLLIRPLVARIKPLGLFFAGNLLTALSILAILLLSSSTGIWLLLPLLCYFVAFVTPTATTIVSNSVDQSVQGEMLGILTSINAAGLVLSSLFSGSFVGAYPALSMIVSGGLMLASAFSLLLASRPKLFS